MCKAESESDATTARLFLAPTPLSGFRSEATFLPGTAVDRCRHALPSALPSCAHHQHQHRSRRPAQPPWTCHPHSGIASCPQFFRSSPDPTELLYTHASGSQACAGYDSARACGGCSKQSHESTVFIADESNSRHHRDDVPDSLLCRLQLSQRTIPLQRMQQRVVEGRGGEHGNRSCARCESEKEGVVHGD